MKVLKLTAILTVFLVALTFNAYAMPKNLNANEPIQPAPYADKEYEYGYRWSWLNDDLCIQFQTGGPATANIPRSVLLTKFDMGLLRSWNESGEMKKRNTYSGKWNQDENGVWSFIFDDDTIPIDLTRIDDVLYAFNGYGELVEGYDYWNGNKTGADGLVTCTDPEFLAYLETQYIPDCTSHE